ncbi:SecY-interacting protein Syd [Lysinibacillus odysseyi]|uniref:Syd protein n=1 Tax=Lysinibacillus odysseyi 34hs-1 = NBRC 100172 TaxID=1220589 RepID=A0A0A3IGU9_9BACI|nr:SecY-interacting protein Syd [Lysinibacillus odysseyi]KGR83949.1 Syd protein [Lysinibacillus odysseyi 34hs-1 = NBRC 100172]
MKQAFNIYFGKLLDKWREYNNSLPQISFNEEVDEFMYESKEDEYGYVFWKPKEKRELFNFDEVESQCNVQLHNSIKQYFNSCWFLELTGYFSSYHINLHPVIPGVEPDYFISILKDYVESQHDILKYIPIGFESNGMLIVLDNNTGEIFIEDFELNEYKPLSKSLDQLIQGLGFKEQM